MVTSFSWHSALVVLSRSLMPASNLLERPTWFGRAMVNCAFRTESCLLRKSWSLRWLHVCICTDASERGFAFAVRVGCRERASEVERVSERTWFWSSSSSVGAGSRALRSIAADAALWDSSSDEGEALLARRDCRADFSEVSLQLLDPSEWKLAAFGGFLREDNIILEARSICMLIALQKIVVRWDASCSFLVILRLC